MPLSEEKKKEYVAILKTQAISIMDQENKTACMVADLYKMHLALCNLQIKNKDVYKNSHILPTGQWYAPSAVN